MLITKFYENQEIFLTGGSGFIGKALIEKLLRSCPGISKIYVLMRGKKNKSADERLLNILCSSLFDRLRDERPEALHKVFAIEGDCSKTGLGIRPEDLDKIKKVSIVYHSAASVRFDDHFRDAILLNTRGTLEMVKIAENLRNLKVFMHVSTTYCYPDKYDIEEKVYPAFADWRTTIKMAETYDTPLLNTIFQKYSNNQPNTYTFTKGLSEQIINEHMAKLPMIIFRPSIVVSTVMEPVAGWMDNFNGPNGLMVACGIGIMRTSYGDPDILSDFVPVDIVVRCMIVASYSKAMENQGSNSLIASTKMDVINCATGLICPVSLGTVIESGRRIIKDNPFEKTLWVPGGSITRCRIWNLIRFICFHIFVAILVDTMLRLSNSKPFLLWLQRRIFAANLALHYFTTKSWKFHSDNLYVLQSLVSSKELEVFGFLQYANTDYNAFIRDSIRGAKLFLLNEPAEASQSARNRFKMFEILDFFSQFIIYLLTARFLIRFAYARIF